jgi:hypothetical protein
MGSLALLHVHIDGVRKTSGRDDQLRRDRKWIKSERWSKRSLNRFGQAARSGRSEEVTQFESQRQIANGL